MLREDFCCFPAWEGAIFGLLAAVLHELGHLGCMTLFGVPPREVRLNPFGIDIVEQDDSGRSYGKDSLIALAGPAINLLAWLTGWGIQQGLGADIGEWMLANLAIGLMNLMPAGILGRRAGTVCGSLHQMERRNLGKNCGCGFFCDLVYSLSNHWIFPLAPIPL